MYFFSVTTFIYYYRRRRIFYNIGGNINSKTVHYIALLFLYKNQ